MVRYHQFLKNQNAYTAAYALQRQCTYPISRTQTQQYETLDKIRLDGTRTEEKWRRKLQTGELDWFLEIQKSLAQLRYWKMSCQALAWRCVSKKMLYRLAQRLQIVSPSQSNQEAMEGLKDAKNKW